ncbi:MAG: hypothetical protein ACOVLC_05110 [Flavobacterium sp.]
MKKITHSNGNAILGFKNIEIGIYDLCYSAFINFQMNKNEQNIGFFKFLKKFDLYDSLELYESDDTFQNWNLLKLKDFEDGIRTKPCDKSQKNK